MGLTSSRGNRPARLHSSIMGTRLSSMNWRVVSRTRRSSSVSSESNWIKSTPRNLIADMMKSPQGKYLARTKAWPEVCRRQRQTTQKGKHLTVAGVGERGQREEIATARQPAQPYCKIEGEGRELARSLHSLPGWTPNYASLTSQDF